MKSLGIDSKIYTILICYEVDILIQCELEGAGSIDHAAGRKWKYTGLSEFIEINSS